MDSCICQTFAASPAQPFEFLALMRATAHPSMQAEAVRIGAQGHRVFFVPAFPSHRSHDHS